MTKYSSIREVDYHLRAPGTLLRRLSRPQPTVLALFVCGNDELSMCIHHTLH
jgi:hypothetical protein